MLELMQEVLVDGIPGHVAGVYPEGKGLYQGKMHAYYWIRTPSLDYSEALFYDKPIISYKQNGRAVKFSDMHRITIMAGEQK
jgi:hypothetical protein